MVEPRVTLVGGTSHTLLKDRSQKEQLLALMWHIWEGVKTNNSREDLYNQVMFDDELSMSKKEDLFKQNSIIGFPPPEFIDFIFEFINVPIAFREQLVRTRSATHWWTTSRITDYSTFADQKLYFVPEAVRGTEQEAIFDKYYQDIQEQYKQMLASGMREEEARYVIPSGVLTRGYLKINLRNLITLVGKRTCQVAQAELWKPIIAGITKELTDTYGDLFNFLVKPPCYECKDKKFNYIGCKFERINTERLAGQDPLPPCAIYVNKENVKDFTTTEKYQSYNESINSVYRLMEV